MRAQEGREAGRQANACRSVVITIIMSQHASFIDCEGSGADSEA